MNGENYTPPTINPNTEPPAPPENLPSEPSFVPETPKPAYQAPSYEPPNPSTPPSPPPPLPPAIPSHKTSEIPPSKLKKSPLKAVFVALAVVLVLVLGLGAVLAFQIYDPLWNPFRPAPEKIIANAVAKMSAVKNFHYESAAELSAQSGEQIKLTSKTIGDFDATDKKKMKASGATTIDFSFEGVSSSFGYESRIIGPSFYLKITSAPSLLTEQIFQESGIDLSQIQNQWYKLDKESLNNLFSSASPLLDSSDLTEKFSLAQELILNNLKKLFLENAKIYFVKEEKPDENINDVKAYHYLIVLNNDELAKSMTQFLVNVATGLGEEMPSAQELQDTEKAITDSFKNLGEISGEIWVGKKDNLIYRIKIDKEIDFRKLDPTMSGAANINLAVNFSKYGKVVNIEEPKDAQDLGDILTSIIGASLIGAQTNQTNAYIKSDLMQMMSAAETIYSENGNYSKVTYKDEDIKILLDDMKSLLGKYPTLRTSSKAYCAFAELLPAKEGDKKTWYCIDSSFNSYEININPGQAGYCSGSSYKCPGGSGLD